jgi:hypothetical protein
LKGAVLFMQRQDKEHSKGSFTGQPDQLRFGGKGASGPLGRRANATGHLRDTLGRDLSGTG